MKYLNLFVDCLIDILIKKKMSIIFLILFLICILSFSFLKQKMWKEDLEKYNDKIFKNMYLHSYKKLTNLKRLISTVLVIATVVTMILVLVI